MLIIPKSVVYFLLLFVIVFTSCTEVNPPYDFKNQDLQGKIENIEWEYTSGVARQSYTSDDTLNIGIYNLEFDNPCSYAISEEGIKFIVPKAVGLYILGGSVNIDDAVIFYHSSIKEYGFGGAIEILNIDSNAMMIEGRADIRVDNESFVNGNFTINFCD